MPYLNPGFVFMFIIIILYIMFQFFKLEILDPLYEVSYYIILANNIVGSRIHL